MGGLDTSLLLWGMLFGSIGLGFIMYGRKQRKIVPLVTGILLSVFPYVVPDNVYIIIAVGIMLMGLPYFVRI